MQHHLWKFPTLAWLPLLPLPILPRQPLLRLRPPPCASSGICTTGSQEVLDIFPPSGLGRLTSKSSLPTSSVVGFSIPASPPLARVPPVRRAELLALLNGATPSRYSALPRLWARGLVNHGNMCFANAVLQLLVYFPPFWRLFKELGRPISQREQGQTQGSGDGATPLVDAPVKLLEEFVYEEKKPLPPPTSTSTQRGSLGKAKDEEEKKEIEGVDSFMPTYVYDGMKKK